MQSLQEFVAEQKAFLADMDDIDGPTRSAFISILEAMSEEDYIEMKRHLADEYGHRV